MVGLQVKCDLGNACAVVSGLMGNAPSRAARVGDACHELRQTLQGSFSAVLKRNFPSMYALESFRRDLQKALLCTALTSHFSFKICVYSEADLLASVLSLLHQGRRSEEKRIVATPGRPDRAAPVLLLGRHEKARRVPPSKWMGNSNQN